jgi:predicted transcriptional regulator
MYKVHKKQERFNKEALNLESVKHQLPEAINEEHERSNVDSSKKRAVMQQMDYDGFHQMVLGAHLKTLKQGEVENINLKAGSLNS